MKWLLTIETEADLIVVCRLMNIFRRKGVKLLTLAMAEAAGGYCIMAVVETPEADGDHHYNFVRRTEGVRHVTCYRQQPSAAASFVFIDSPEATPLDAARWRALGARLIFASHGKMLLDVPAGADLRADPIQDEQCLSFARVKSTRDSVTPLAG